MKRPTEYFKRTYKDRDYWKFDENPSGDVTILLNKEYVNGKSRYGECVVLYGYFSWIFDADLGIPVGDVFDHVLEQIEDGDFSDLGGSADRNDPEFMLDDYQIDMSKVTEFNQKGDR